MQTVSQFNSGEQHHRQHTAEPTRNMMSKPPQMANRHDAAYDEGDGMSSIEAMMQDAHYDAERGLRVLFIGPTRAAARAAFVPLREDPDRWYSFRAVNGDEGLTTATGGALKLATTNGRGYSVDRVYAPIELLSNEDFLMNVIPAMDTSKAPAIVAYFV